MGFQDLAECESDRTLKATGTTAWHAWLSWQYMAIIYQVVSQYALDARGQVQHDGELSFWRYPNNIDWLFQTFVSSVSLLESWSLISFGFSFILCSGTRRRLYLCGGWRTQCGSTSQCQVSRSYLTSDGQTDTELRGMSDKRIEGESGHHWKDTLVYYAWHPQQWSISD
jgi:hypothetical protein